MNMFVNWHVSNILFCLEFISDIGTMSNIFYVVTNSSKPHLKFCLLAIGIEKKENVNWGYTASILLINQEWHLIVAVYV